MTVLLRLSNDVQAALAAFSDGTSRLTLTSGHRLVIRGTQRLTLYGLQPGGRLVLAGRGG